ncbi:MAG: GNAT family N-acetyltransferase [Oscillospiraceae bacterium]|nr:GNAT family N-acetyltransferase [Oscillospiraceae bacterium]
MIATAQKSMYPVLKRLWQTSFGDSAACTDFLFGHIPPGNILVWLEDKTIASMLVWYPVELVLPDGIIPCAYMFGFNTHPLRRGQGIGARLLDGMHTYLKSKGYEAVLLAPASESLFGYYARYGYETLFNVKTATLTAGELRHPASPCTLLSRGLDSLCDERGEFFGGDRLFARWDKSFLRLISEDCKFRSGNVLRFACGDANGYVAYYPIGEGKIRITELGVPPRRVNDVLYALYKRSGVHTFEIRLPEDYQFNAENKYPVLPFVMIRWYDREKWMPRVEALPHPPYFAHILD